MNIGFTGTREGMTEAQRQGVGKMLLLLRVTRFHHGDCIGADANANCLVSEISPGVPIEVHPCDLPDKYRAFCAGEIVHDPKPPLERNRDIVDASDFLLAAPKENEEVQRSDTWATIRYARQANRNGVIFYPDGRREPLGFGDEKADALTMPTSY